MSPKPRRKVKHQTPIKKKHRRERAAPNPNVVVGSALTPEPEKAPIASKVGPAPETTVAAALHAAPKITNGRPIIAELKQVGILGGGIIVVLVVLAMILG